MLVIQGFREGSLMITKLLGGGCGRDLLGIALAVGNERMNERKALIVADEMEKSCARYRVARNATFPQLSV